MANTITGMKFENSVAFKFWKTLAKLDINYTGWKLAAYWRDMGYDE
jgi:hypothetical protein